MVKIAGLQKVSLLDFPGRIAATIFLAGCNLNCGYCHNRWMLRAEEVVEALSLEDCLRWLSTRRGRLDGVCISGGEPTLGANLPAFLRAIKQLGFATKLDTNGTLPERLQALLVEGTVDYVALDLKAPLDERYGQVAGREVDVAAIRRTMALLRAWIRGAAAAGEKAGAGARPAADAAPRRGYEYRTTVAPLLDEAALGDIACELQPEERWVLQRFVPAEGVDPALAALPAPDEEALAALAARLAQVAPGVRVRGAEG